MGYQKFSLRRISSSRNLGWSLCLGRSCCQRSISFAKVKASQKIDFWNQLYN